MWSRLSILELIYSKNNFIKVAYFLGLQNFLFEVYCEQDPYVQYMLRSIVKVLTTTRK